MTPLKVNTELTTQELDALTQTRNDETLKNKTQYQRLIGKMLYLTLTRPDITYLVKPFIQFLQQTERSHWDATVRVMKYVNRE